jgi:hypothetical protein
MSLFTLFALVAVGVMVIRILKKPQRDHVRYVEAGIRAKAEAKKKADEEYEDYKKRERERWERDNPGRPCPSDLEQFSLQDYIKKQQEQWEKDNPGQSIWPDVCKPIEQPKRRWSWL